MAGVRPAWWLRRIVRPWESARVLAPRLLPPRLRLRLTALLARLRGDGDDRAAERTAATVESWQQAIIPDLERPLRPTVLCLPGVGGGPADEPLLDGLGEHGWPVVRVASTAADVDTALESIDELRRQQRIRAAVTLYPGPRWAPFAGRLEEEFGWPALDSAECAGWGDPDTFERAVRARCAKVSALVVTHNNAHMTRLCLASVRAWTAYPNLEVIVVDNASSDDTGEVLAELARVDPTLRVIVNRENRGFAAACNQAADSASGEILCFLNNDTVVTPGWLWVLVRALQEQDRLGLVGPVSNAVGNEARVRSRYTSLEEMRAWAERRVWRRDGRWFSLPMLALFCAATRREVWDRIGELDEAFGLGLFEDDDYCRRLRLAGYALGCRQDAFVHHWQQATFSLLEAERYLDLYERNRQYYRRKWRRRGRRDAV